MDKSEKPTRAWGIASMVLGIISLLLIFAPYIGIYVAIAAVVFYSIQKKHEATGMATAGLVTGVIGIIINGIMLLFVVGGLLLFSSLTDGFTDLDSANTEDVGEVVESTLQDNPEMEYIQNHVKLENVQVGEGYGQFDTPGFSDPKPSVSGTLKNNGDKTLDRVEITIYFLDSEGKRIGEKEYAPVTTYSIMGDDTPLKPNYVRDWGYVFTDAPTGWDERVQVVVSDITFGE